MTTDRTNDSAAFLNLPPIKLIIGQTAAMQAIVEKLERVAETDVPVLFQGESGTGKEVFARLLHGLSTCADTELVKINCLAIPSTLLETELFGYERGAFTGALATKRGRLEQAHQGTLFLDEVGSLDVSVQAKLLQVLEDGTFVRVGGQELRTISTRIISAANGNLWSQVDDGTFRLDFLFRINAVTVNLPPLRERTADLPTLVEYFIEQYSQSFRAAPPPLSKAVLQWMEGYRWPGNIRQLENLIRSYVLIGNEEALFSELIPQAPSADIVAGIALNEPISLKRITKQATEDLERQIIFKVLEANSGNRQKTAKWLKISYRSLLYKLTGVGTPEVPGRKPRKGRSTKEGTGPVLRPALVSRPRPTDAGI